MKLGTDHHFPSGGTAVPPYGKWWSVPLFCLMSTVAAAQTMYKWVDEKGVTHFSQDPPPDGTKGAAKIEVRPTAPSAPAVDNWRDRELQSKEKRAKQGVADETARQKEESQRESKCRAARRQADTMENSARVFRLDDKGQRVYLEDKERAADLAEARRDIAQYCR